MPSPTALFLKILRPASLLAAGGAASVIMGLAAAPQGSGQTPPRDSAKDGAKDAKAKGKEGLDDPARNPRLQLKLDDADRAPINDWVGYTAPEFPEGLQWVGTEPMTMAALRGKVVAIQSLSTKGPWRGAVEPLRKQLDGLGPDVVVVLLHTPEGADRAKPIMDKALDGWFGVIDAKGNFCNDLGVWKKPVNFLVDRNGVVRYAGLTPEGMKAGAVKLLAEKAEQDPLPKPRPASGPSESKIVFPTFTDPVQNGVDQRGKAAPALAVETWVTQAPDMGKKLLVLDFWATWCGPCRASIPHMNELAGKFSQDACFIGISDETKSKFEEGMRNQKLKERDFKYSLALDPQARLKSGFFKLNGIPCCAIISSDGVVRWQGHPVSLSEDVLRSLVAANNSLNGGGKSGKGAATRGWRSKD